MATNPAPNRKLRPRRKKMSYLILLNKDIADLNLSVHAQASLIKLGIKNLAQLRREIETNNLPVQELGLKSRIELNDIFKQNHLSLPPNWIWGIKN